MAPADARQTRFDAVLDELAKREDFGSVRYAQLRREGYVPVERAIELRGDSAQATLLMLNDTGHSIAIVSENVRFVELALSHLWTMLSGFRHFAEESHFNDHPALVVSEPISVHVRCGLLDASGKTVEYLSLRQRSAGQHGWIADYRIGIDFDEARKLCPVPTDASFQIRVQSGTTLLLQLHCHVGYEPGGWVTL